VHPVYLACAFRRHYRSTVGEYVRRLRVEFACRELSATRAPLAQVALAAGFADQSQFSRTFKRVVGLTPTEYRKMFRAP
jgi:AraC family transcriptional regulator